MMHDADYEAMKKRRDSHKNEYHFYRGRIRHERWVRTAILRSIIGFILTGVLLVTLGVMLGSGRDGGDLATTAVWTTFMAAFSTFTLVFREKL